MFVFAKKIKNYLLLTLFLFTLTLLSPLPTKAKIETSEWYIKDFKMTIEVFNDDSALITEDIIADAGNARGKHGIFRIVATRSNTPEGYIYTPIELISITDFSGKAYNYQTSSDAGTLTWKIGSPQITVTGENNYRIVYRVRNIIRDQGHFDEFYYNLSGNYWDMRIENFKAEVILPNELNKESISLSLYDGKSGSKSNTLSTYRWLDNKRLEVKSTANLKEGEGITLSLSFPTGYIQHEIINSSAIVSQSSTRGTPFNLFLVLRHLIIPPIVLIISLFFFLRKQRRNIYHKRTIIAQYEAPNNISPLILGCIYQGNLATQHITASIVKMAVLKLLTIEEKKTKILFFSKKNLEFKKTKDQSKYQELDDNEKFIFNLLFERNDIINSEELKKIFSNKMTHVAKRVKNNARFKGYFITSYLNLKNIYLIAAIVALFTFSIFSFVILIILYNACRNLSEKGEEALWHIKGLKKYLTVAEKDRHAFYEKENIFTKLLPYSIALGVVREWVKKMEDIYGQEYIAQSLYWYSGASTLSALSSIDSVASSINSISNNINNSMGTSSGSGGGGSSGGGSGGGGGGGW